MCRNNVKDPTHISVSITENFHLHRTAVAVTNVSLGHTTILKILAMIYEHPSQSSQESNQDYDDNGRGALDAVATVLPTASPRSPSPPPPIPPARTKITEIAIDLHRCRLVCRYQDPLPGSNISVPGQVRDYFFVLKDMIIIELPRMELNLPFLIENIVDDGGGVGDSVPLLTLENAELILATTGVPGYYLLPMLRLPSVVVGREIVRIDSFSSSAAVASSAFCQVLKVNAPCVEVGVHPSHLIIGTLAMQLLQQEFIALLGGNVDSSSVENTTQARTPSPPKTGHQRATELESPQELLESVSSDVFLSPRGLVSPLSPSPTAASTPPATTVATAEEQAAPATLWRMETTMGLASLSLLGSLLTSTCLKIECHHLFSTISNIPADVASSSSSSNSFERNADGDESSSLLVSLTTTMVWSHLSVHVMRPKDTGELMESCTPFHGMDGFFSTPQLSLGGGVGLGPSGPGSVLSGAGGEGGGNVGGRTGFHPHHPGLTPPSQIVPGIASAAGAGMKQLNSFSASGSAAAAGINHQEIAATNGDDAVAANQEEQENIPILPDAPSVDSPIDTPSFADARSARLSRISVSGGGGGSIISRNFSAQDSELYEDAASELFLPDGSKIIHHFFG